MSNEYRLIITSGCWGVHGVAWQGFYYLAWVDIMMEAEASSGCKQDTGEDYSSTFHSNLKNLELLL
jgi:hypothetical protein